jgi:hypothetical protein
MLRRKAAAKPEQMQWHFDPSKSYTLEDIGLRYNAEKDNITLLDQPEEAYRYKMKAGDEEYNDQLWLALCRILREMTTERLAQNEFTRLRMPLGAAETERHTELYVSEGYEKKKELTIVLPDDTPFCCTIDVNNRR